MRIIFACGGTGGHINPAIAVANYIKTQEPDTEILFIGNPKGMEARLVPQAGYNFAPVEIMGIQRKINLRNIKYNIKSVGCLLTYEKKAKKIISNFKPDIVMGTGGYMSGAILRTANKMGIKTVAHEQNAYPGVANKMSFNFVDGIFLAVEQAKEFLPHNKEYIITGNPIREEIILADRQAIREKLNIQDKICILTFGGSLGASKINEAVADIMEWHKNRDDIYHIHATGRYGAESFPKLLEDRGVDYKNVPHIDIREYINDMEDCLAAADLVVSRSGALTLSEIQSAGRASILIPSPNVAANHQYYNAMVLVNNDAAVLIEEKNLTKQSICQQVEELVSKPERLAQLGKNTVKMAIIDANKQIYENILRIVNS